MYLSSLAVASSELGLAHEHYLGVDVMVFQIVNRAC